MFFVVGQNVTISIEVNNESRIDVEYIKVSLKKIIFYNSQTPTTKTKAETLTEADIRCGGVTKQNKGKFEQQLIIPPVPPSNLNYCRVLNVSYEIHVTAKISGIHQDPVLKLPITIGTVPLHMPMSQSQQVAIAYPSAPDLTPSPVGIFSITDTINHQPNMQQSNGELRK